MAKNEGYLLPENLDPEQVSICICIPCDTNHALAFLGQLKALGDWWTWEKDEEKRGRLAAQPWRQIYIDVDSQLRECGVFDMGCGCDEKVITNRRWNEQWIPEVSYDGGDTWVVDTASDPRFSGAIAPPPLNPDSEDSKCAAAASGREVFKTDFIDTMNDGDAYAAVFALLLIIATPLFGPAGPPLAALVTGAVMTATIALVRAAMTEGVLDTYQCILYCNMGDDAAFDTAEWEVVCTEILEQLTGIAATILWHWVRFIGPVGLTNSIRSARVSEADNCDDCGCSEPCTHDVIIGANTFGVPGIDGWNLIAGFWPGSSGLVTYEYAPNPEAEILLELCFNEDFRVTTTSIKNRFLGATSPMKYEMQLLDQFGSVIQASVFWDNVTGAYASFFTNNFTWNRNNVRKVRLIGTKVGEGRTWEFKDITVNVVENP